MSNPNRDKSHSECSNRHSYQPVQTVLHSVQGHRLGNVAINPPRSDELLAYPENSLREEVIVRYSNGWIPLSSKPQIKKIQEYHSQKKEASKEEAPVSSTSKPQSTQLPHEGKKKKKRNEENIFPKLQDPKNPK
ncbi:hypothetical protein O181_032831 [Austropuccinia psidii MF-1]|uniref:Uncharacterized protein n=1 Tax=Austropuccinia psidii MF-1 TaxID=1389203 RepID=A0A9Q3D365_9BASI|nr:hypothetical protein [Austropuccinia psidii MF-1]